MEMKTCRTCVETLPLTAFGKEKRYKDGYSTECKSCKNERNRASKRKQLTAMTEEELEAHRKLESAANQKYRAKRTDEQRERTQLLKTIPKFIRERDELKPYIDLLSEHGSDIAAVPSVTFDDFYDLEKTMLWASKPRFAYPGFSDARTNIEKRYGYLCHRISLASPELIALALEREVEREAGLRTHRASVEEERLFEEMDERKKEKGEST